MHLYGSTRDYSLIDEHSNLNAGLGEGVSYRGRLLIALKTDISDSIDTAPSEVEVEPTQTIHEVTIKFQPYWFCNHFRWFLHDMSKLHFAWTLYLNLIKFVLNLNYPGLIDIL